MATYEQIWGGTASIIISSLRLCVLGVGFFYCYTLLYRDKMLETHTKSYGLNS